jgi:secreted trypsin-like serine protease
MKRLVLCAVVALLCSSVAVLAITNGTLDTVHTYVGAIVVPNVFGYTGFTGGNGYISCSGTLLSPRVFLTAGHCVNALIAFGVTSDQVHVNFDATNVYTPSTSWLNVASYALMPGFQITGGNTPDTNDIGVVILANPINNITPAQLAPVGFLDSYPALNKAIVSVLGYGVNENLVLTGNRLITISNVVNLNDTWLKRSSTPGGTCSFDSGGPTLLIQGTTEYQIGVHSSQTGGGSALVSCGANLYDTRIDATAVQNFIEAQIAANP